MSGSMMAGVIGVTVLAATTVTAAYTSPLSNRDLARAYLPKPLASSHVVGENADHIFKAMNRWMIQQSFPTKPCEAFTHGELNDLARKLWPHRSERLASIYKDAADNRQFHFEGLDYKERLWAQEAQLEHGNAALYGPGSKHHKMVQDGKCAEMVMWWIHHLSEDARGEVQRLNGFHIPLLPAEGLVGDDLKHASKEYIYQVSCSDCHSTGVTGNASTTKIPVLRSRDPVDGVPAGTCPVDPQTNKPIVWYEPMSDIGNRKKRCDWDYDPPCGLCEGIGGYVWGDQEHEIAYTSCKPVALAENVAVEERRRPIWPKAFVVDEITTLINQKDQGGQFPGANPCAEHKIANDTETMYYDDMRVNFSGPIMWTKASKTSIYTLPDADMFIKISGVYCICVTPYENSNKSLPATGPLRHDFAHDAVYIGREEIGLEGLGTSVVADHWNKGPHHFWVSVETGLFVRGFQPWNGLNVYIPGTWRVGPVDKQLFDVPKSCYKGVLHKNVSCASPYPQVI